MKRIHISCSPSERGSGVYDWNVLVSERMAAEHESKLSAMRILRNRLQSAIDELDSEITTEVKRMRTEGANDAWKVEEVMPGHLYWHCAECGEAEPAQPEYTYGDREPCICGRGIACVMLLHDVERLEQQVALGTYSAPSTYKWLLLHGEGFRSGKSGAGK